MPPWYRRHLPPATRRDCGGRAPRLPWFGQSGTGRRVPPDRGVPILVLHHRPGRPGESVMTKAVKVTVTERGGRKYASTGSQWEPVIGYSRAVRSGNAIFVTGT